MEEIIKTLNAYVLLYEVGGYTKPLEMNLDNAKQLLQALEWRGCDSCKYSIINFTAKNNKLMCDEPTASTPLWHKNVTNKISCIHHKQKGE